MPLNRARSSGRVAPDPAKARSSAARKAGSSNRDCANISGSPGRRAFTSAVRQVRDEHAPDYIIVNGENAKHGSGLHPDGYKDIRKAGADAVTLGDHWLRARQIFPILEDPELFNDPVGRFVANLDYR